MRHGSRAVLALSAGLAGAAGAQNAPSPAPVPVHVTVTGLRAVHGQILACLVNTAAAFPDCSRDPAARKLAVPVRAATVELDFGAVPPGSWAVAVVHDENGNGRMDKRLIMPREGYGFSRDAPVRMGPPSFRSAAFAVGAAPVRHSLRMRYMF
jgi:uncharacterized protein (DUF2141 family)